MELNFLKGKSCKEFNLHRAPLILKEYLHLAHEFAFQKFLDGKILNALIAYLKVEIVDVMESGSM